MMLIAGIIVGFMLAMIVRMVEMHVQDRRHGRLPGSEQPPEYIEWARKQDRHWYWPR